MKRYFQQIRYQFRTQPVILIISVVGTALSIAFVMMYFLMRQVYITPFPPESNRDRTLHIVELKYGSSELVVNDLELGELLVRKCFYPLRSVEAVTAYTGIVRSRQISLPGGENMQGSRMKATDAAFWRVFNFTFLHGRAYTDDEFNSALPRAVIDEDVARSLWGTTDVVGRFFEFNYSPYQVTGVVQVVSSQAFLAESKIWIPYTTIHRNVSKPVGVYGPFYVSLLAKDKKDFPAIRKECKEQVARFNATEMAPFEGEISLHINVNEVYLKRDQPYNQESVSLRHLLGTTGKPGMRNAIIYLMLLLIPSLNLGAMLNSRLRRQRVEIGVHRSFGATRFRLVREMCMESLLTTLAGGMLGLLICFGVLSVASEHFLYLGKGIDLHNLIVVFFDWWVYFYALLACVVLNLLSSLIPVWRAVHVDIADALGGGK